MGDSRRLIGVVATAARALVGTGLVVWAILRAGVGWWDVAGAFLVMPAITVVVVPFVDRVLSGSDLKRAARVPWSAAQMTASAVAIVAVLALGTGLTFATPLDAGTLWLFVGVSMLLAAALGYDGCEILALPNLVSGRRDAIWCPLFAPADHVDSGAASRTFGS